ncbi:MAG: hypothetical protein QW478_14690, partial [Candidatus Micrarchaeaceae archaeon]
KLIFAFLSFCDYSLPICNSLFLLFEELWLLDGFTIRQGNEIFQPLAKPQYFRCWVKIIFIEASYAST